jgi:hypothetical protein
MNRFRKSALMGSMRPPSNLDGLFEEGLELVPEDERGEFLANLEELAREPGD